MRLLSIGFALTFTACEAGKYPDPPGEVLEEDLDGDGLVGDMDCDPLNANIGQGLDELCDGLDNDCDGEIDEEPVDGPTWYNDGDGDGYGSESNSVQACTQPSGYSESFGDCDDLNSAVNPGAAEICDGIDNDCDNLIDDEDELDDAENLWGLDSDGDGYGDAENTVYACEQPSGYVDNIEDCADSDSSTYNGAAYNDSATDCMTDADGDGYGDPNPTLPGAQAGTDCDDSDPNTYNGAAYNDSTTECMTDADGDGFGDWLPGTQIVQAGSDCDDGNSDVNINGLEICGDGIDNNCDGNIDDGTASDALTWYLDSDGDGYGDPNISIQACAQPSGYVLDNTDCDDSSNTTYNGAAYNDSTTDCMSDSDGDGYGDINPTVPGVQAGTDCDDSSNTTYNGVAYNDSTTECMSDADGDGYGDATPSVPGVQAGTDCSDSSSTTYMGAAYNEAPSACMEDSDGDGYGDANPSDPNVDVGTDCDDSSNTSYPGAAEVCDNIDNDCNGLVDDNITSGGVTWYADLDGDGYGNANLTLQACSAPSGYVLDDSDCDDTDPFAYIGAAFNDDPAVCMSDSDGDGYGDSNPSNPNVDAGADCDDGNNGISPSALEVCGDGIDNNCDGNTDDGSSSDALTWYLDSDGDGYGDPNSSIQACTQPSGYVADNTDCDDNDEFTYVGAAYNDDPAACMSDVDGDGYGDPNPSNPNVTPGTDCDAASASTYNGAAFNDSTTDCMTDADGDGYGDFSPSNPNALPGTDCNDGSNISYPGALEICDTLDNDCNGFVDDGQASNGTEWFLDSDGDGYGDPNNSLIQCGQPSGYVLDNTDCDDNDEFAYVGAAENDDPTACMSDVDGDGYGDANPSNPNVTPGTDCSDGDSSAYVGAAFNDSTTDCMADSDGDGYGDSNPSDPNVDAGSDCDDSDVFAYVGAAFNDSTTDCMTDSDGDGYGDSNPSNPNVDAGSDCNDLEADISPMATEVCDGIDNDCDGLTDDNDLSLDLSSAQSYYGDGDGDGYGDPNSSIQACIQPSGYVSDNTDCDDNDEFAYVGAAYNQSILDCMSDSDGDGYGDSNPSNPNVDAGADCDDGNNGISPSALEVCGDGIDNNCDGNTDDGSSSDALTWYLDSDGDGFGDPNSSIQACTPPSGYVADNTDCDDSSDTTYIGSAQNDDPAACMSDADGDGYGDSNPSNPNVDAGTDCDDSSDTTYVGAAQNDSTTDCMSDADGDGYGDANPSDPNVTPGTDCSDGDSSAYVGAAFNDSTTDCMADGDGDGYGDANPSDPNVTPGTDCDDNASDVNSAATEICDGIDNDCDGLTDDADASLDLNSTQTYYSDADGDGYGDPNVSIDTCTQPPNYVLDNNDCNDDPSTGLIAAPNVAETCDFVDNDCDGVVDAPGTVAFFPAAGGLPIDFTSSFTGTSSQPATPILNTAGTVVLCDGSYYVNMTVRNDIVLSPNGSVVLDGADMGTIVNIDQSNVTFEASDMVFYNGYGNQEIIPGYPYSGGGLACFGYSDVTLDNVEFSYNVGDLGGALISIACNLNITNSDFNTNAAVYGGGIYGTDANFNISDTVFELNYASSVGGGAVFGESNVSSTLTGNNLSFIDNEGLFGAGLNVQVLTVNLSASLFDGNLGYLGGGLNVLAGDFTGDDLLFQNNTASYYGGAAAIGAEDSNQSTISLITNSTVQNNSAPNGGGIIYLEGQNTLEDSSILNNSATNFGGGLFVGDEYDDTLTYTNNHLEMIDTLIQGNSATYGGGMYLRFEATAQCNSTYGTLGGFHNNTASIYGGAAHLTNDVVFTGETCDMGLNSTENSPEDITIELSSSIGAYNYADNAIFTCDGTGCTP